MDFAKVNRVWPLVNGGVIAPVVLTILVVVLVRGTDMAFYQWLLWLHLPLFMFHEYEEYFLPGGFKRFANYDSPLASSPPADDAPLNDAYELAVNAFFWTVIIAGALLANVAPWVGFIGIVLQLTVNNFTHTVAFQTPHRGYNPGLITTVFVLMPYCTLVIAYILMDGIFTPLDWVLGIGVPLLAVAVMFVVTMTRRKHASAGGVTGS